MAETNGSATVPLFLYSLTVAVDDDARLQRAAEAKAAAEGYDMADWRAKRAGPATDLILMLDPGATPPGCRIVSTTADEI